tara:strand:- start:3 stop:152 length:150 start_codon:yes stop_codon:yes gene_type:complete
MKYKIERIDVKSDDITSQVFKNYDDAYDLLDNIYKDLGCSEADYNDQPY